MAIQEKEVEVQLNGSIVNYYETLGYEIPRVYKNYKWSIPQGTTIFVKVNDLKESSNVYIHAECDCCGSVKRIQYNQYNQNIKRNGGIYSCSLNSDHRDFINGISLNGVIEEIKSFYERNKRFPKYNEYTNNNGFSCTYSKMMEVFKRHNTTLNEELSKIDCFKTSKHNPQYYDVYLQKLKQTICNNPQLGKNLYALSREDNCQKYELPNIRWFIEHCPNKSVTNIDTFKEWVGLYKKIMTKEQCSEIILEMAKSLDRPLMYDDFRGHEYGQVTITMLKEHWGSLNKMKEDLGLKVNIESMIDKQLSKEEFDVMIQDICDFVSNEERDFITTREIDLHKEWNDSSNLRKYAQLYYDLSLKDFFATKGINLGNQGCGLTYDFNDGEHITSQFEYMFSKFLRDYGLKYNVNYFRDVKYSTFIPEYKNNMNCDYVIHINNKIIYLEIAGIIDAYKNWFYEDRPIVSSKSKEKYRQKLKEKEQMLKKHNLLYFILFPCDLTKENMKNILEDGSLELKKKIETFIQNNIDWVKIREVGELDYSKPFLRNTRPKKEAV